MDVFVFEGWRAFPGRVMVKTFVFGTAADFSSMADMIAGGRIEGSEVEVGRRGSVMENSRLRLGWPAMRMMQERNGVSSQ